MNLGYSDFQGDEIKALFLPEPDQTVQEFLLEQRKGPLQFLITYLIKFIDPLYQDQFLNRIPFAIAGFLSILFFYGFVKEIYGKKIAAYASFFFITNGFLIAFSRIVQYQSFVILFMLSSLYFLKKKNIYLGLISWALSILAHYDGVFIFPLVSYFIYEYLTNSEEIKNNKSIKHFKFKLFKANLVLNSKRLKHFIVSGFISLSLLLAFYIPFVINVMQDVSTQDYWLGRITGDVSSKLSNSNYLFTVYQPIYVIHIYYFLSIIGLGLVIYLLFLSNIKFKLFKSIFKVITSFISFNTENKNITFGILFWFFVSIVFMEVFVSIPGTHIYTYLIPLMIFMGIGISLLEGIFKGLLRKIINISTVNLLFVFGVSLVFTFIFAQSFSIFVDNKQEYPWESEKFLLWTFPQPTPVYHLSMFGFPYFRDWEGIQEFVLSSKSQPAYSTNERESISRHYINLPKDTDVAGFYVYIFNPQTFTNTITNKKVEYWSSKYEPNYVFQRNGIDLVKIFIMETGALPVIKAKGF